ncbi:MFS transporter [Adlercreutzia sp. ZJ141]|uniref:MFS transporter n=1 Tax=Adlercreutzia sp. ZJ141 TaxID=2709406 RepID=UPI0013EB3140|nr:MFS transporter [Adlercreutzia sp. ZJ141]
MVEVQRHRIHRGFLVFAACCAICFSTVTLSFNTMGIFYTPAGTDLGISAGAFGTYMSVQYLAMAVSMIFGGKILHRFNARWVLTGCCAMVSVGISLMSVYNYIWQFYCSGVLIGCANSILLYLMVPTMIDRWFKDRVGFFVGICLCFTGVGAVVFNPLGGWVIENFGWRTGYLVFCLITALVGLPSAIFLIRNKPEDMSLAPWVSAKNKESVPEEGIVSPVKGIMFNQALRTPALWLVALYAGMMDVGITLNYYIPSYVSSLAFGIFAASTVSSAIMVGQMIGKLLLGYINDINVKMGVVTAVACGIIGISVMTFLGGSGIYFLYIGGFFYGIFFAGATVTTSLMTRGIFGSKDYSRVFSVVSTVATLSSAFTSAIWGAIIDITGSYTLTLSIGIGMMFVTFLIGYLAFYFGKKINSEEE